MKYLRRSFYVGGLSAAAYHGAAHQRPQTYQVVTDRPLRGIVCRGMRIHFFVKRRVTQTPVQPIKAVTGYIPVSTPEATALDLLRYSQQVGGLNHVLTVLQELAEIMHPGRLVKAAAADGRLAYAQRLGWLLGKTDFPGKADRLATWVKAQKPFPVKLQPSLPAQGHQRDERWMLLVNTEVEGDLS